MTQKSSIKSKQKSVFIETENLIFKKRRYKILEIRIKPTTRVVDRKVAVELWQQVMKLGNPQLILFDGRVGTRTWQLDGLNGLSEAQRDDVSIAILPQKSQTKGASEFLIQLMSDYFTLKTFSEEKQALTWLKEEGKKYKHASKS